MSYLKEILSGNYSDYKEDRLSQIFSSSFNNSVLFKKAFFKIIEKKPGKLSDYRSVTQKRIDNNSRLDILLYHKNKPTIIIENKVDAPLGSKQLIKYDSVKRYSSCKKIVLAKHFFESYSGLKKWKIHHWSEIYAKYKLILGKGITNPIEKFIFKNFIEHLEQLNMTRVNQITEKELYHFSESIYRIRNKPNPVIALSNKSIFETGSQILSMFEEIIHLAHKEPLIVNSVGKSFRYKPYISSWYTDKNPKYKNIYITVSISLSNSPNKYYKIGTGLFFNNETKKCVIKTFARIKGNVEFQREIEYKRNGKGIVFDNYADQVISDWKKTLRCRGQH